MGIENNIPEGWTESVLGDVMDIFSGKSRPKDNGIYPVYGGNGIHSYGDKYNQQNETLIIGRVGAYCGNVYKENNKFWLSDNALGVKSNEDSDLNYLYYKLKSMKLNNVSIGAAQPLLTQSLLKELEVIIPKKTSEQKAIAKVLTAFDDKIELLQAQNNTLETMAQTIFKEWFGKYQIGDELPEGWRVGKLGDFKAKIADFVANGSFASLKENVTLFNHPEHALFIRNTDLKSDFKEKTYVDKKAYEFLSKTKLFGGEIIISNVGDVGSVHLCPHFKIPMTLGNNIIMLKSEHNYFFYTLFKSRIGQHLISTITGGSAQPKFNKTDFRNMGLIIPPNDLLNNFEFASSKFYQKILKNKEQILSLTKTRNTLLPKLMSGQVRVNNLKQTVDA